MTKEERQQLCVEFCGKLPDHSLEKSVEHNFDALKLWNQRDNAFLLLAKNNLNPYEKVAR